MVEDTFIEYSLACVLIILCVVCLVYHIVAFLEGEVFHE